MRAGRQIAKAAKEMFKTPRRRSMTSAFPATVAAAALAGALVLGAMSDASAQFFGRGGMSNVGRGGPRMGGMGDGWRARRAWRPVYPRGPGVYMGRHPVEEFAGPPRRSRWTWRERRRDSSQGSARSGAVTAGPRVVPDEVITRVGASASTQTLDALARRHGLVRLEAQTLQVTGVNLVRWRITGRRSVAEVVRALGNDANVAAAQPNVIFIGQQAREAGGNPAQYALAKLLVPQAHQLATGNNILVAVVDSGIDTKHPEFAGAIADSFDAVGSGAKVDGHGTAIAGAIAAHARLMGIAPAAHLLAVRALIAGANGAEGTGYNIVKGVDWAAMHGARIINLSFAGAPDPELGHELAAVRAKGVVLIAAVGNDGAQSAPLYPAADPNVIAVTATDAQDHLFAAANRGRHVAIAAPGVDILVAAPNSTYRVSSGTSFAAVHVSGIAALILERKPGATPDEVRDDLLTTAKQLGPQGRDDQFGAGLADAQRALLALEPTASRTLVNGARGDP
jgi:subtilisin family serine protease